MLAPLPSIEAFRRDAVSKDAVGLDDGIAASWLESAIRLERAAMTRGAERDRFLVGLLAQHDVMAIPDAPVSLSAVFSMVSDLAAEMEDQACFRLGHSVLSTLLLVLPETEATLRGRVIAQQARLARHLGDEQAAARYYEEVEQLGIEHEIPELVGRGRLGHGLLAYARGDFPSARRHMEAVVALEGAVSETVGYAHHQLMAMAANGGDYDTAAQHAWKAFRGAATTNQETDALLNLAQLLLMAGHSRGALRGFAAALARNPIVRLELHILGGAACAAVGALPNAAARALVRNFAERAEFLVRGLKDGHALPYPSASTLVELSEALAAVGDEQRARSTADEAERLITAHGYHQLAHRLENPILVVAKPVPLAPATQAIIEAVNELEGAELVAAG